jgi:TetR/AcrR family transcriptional regulator, tetracycline repressor protein
MFIVPDRTRPPQPAGLPQSAAPPPPWRSAPLRRGIARPQLSRERVVQAALQLIEAGGGKGLSMRRVADGLGVSASSLYGYVASKEELVQLVLDRIFDEVKPPPGDLGWQEGLRQYAREILQTYRRHPGVAALTLGRVPLSTAMFASVETSLEVFRAIGMPDEVAAYVGDLAGLYIGAFAYEQDIAAGGQPDPAQIAAWLGSLPAGRFPNIVAMARSGKLTAGSADDRFEWGLDVIIRGLGTYLEDPPTREARWPVGDG